MKQERMLHIDLLRIIACFSVVMLHSSAQYWYGLPLTDKNWLVINTYDALVRFGVPVFVMISGSLFLSPGKPVDLKRLYRHNILRLAILYIVWSAIYGLYDCLCSGQTSIGIQDVLKEIYSGRYHLWYLPMIIGLYMLLPLFKGWLKNASRRDVEYFLGLFLLFKIFRYTLLVLKPMDFAAFLLNIFDVDDILSYPGYFILGYYMTYYKIDRRWHKWIYAGGLLGAVANAGLSYYKSLRQGLPNGEVFDSFSLFTFLVVAALFLFSIEKVSKWKFNNVQRRIISELSQCTLGIYLMHLLCMELLASRGIDSMMLPPIAGVPLCALLCFCLCFLFTALLRRIPFLGRYLC